MPPRSYVSSVRTAAAAEKRDRVLEAAAKLLREDASIARFLPENGLVMPNWTSARSAASSGVSEQA